jgi:hypothetical protein
MDRYNDEAMLRDIRHVSHRDGMREGIWAGSLVFGVLLALFVAFAPQLPTYPVSLFLVVVSVSAGWWVKRRIARAAALPEDTPELVSRRAREMREMREADTERRIAAAKASGAFDRWDAADRN